MSDIDTKLKSLQASADTADDKSVKTAVKAGLQNKTVQVSLFSVAAIAACGAVGYALTRPSNKRRLSRYSNQISGYLPGSSRRTGRTEQLANQIADAFEGVFKR